ncbi:GAF domain-containing protein [Thermostichus vulcanus]|uniref:histidine kinase n=1 Tax=Thermostichus vulcanus str. 'Rupite' TaxID=2813851 RepID=A0ABT0C9X7_THEVL|nr:GAF domain-containing protein [Thermostichus vulcanus]MCJ2542580.1 GAF domain-containing protein [Thermostichus vulcanus str. 'Rupite']
MSVEIPSSNVRLHRDALINRITNQIRQSLQLNQILTATVEEVRSFLGTDRVKVYRFDPEGHGKVIAESIREGRLPSLRGLSFPASDIPPQARQLFRRAQVRVIVDVEAQSRSISQPEYLTLPTKVQPLPDHELPQRPVDPCHIHYLKGMGVASSLAIPLMHHQHLWGLLVSHHAEPRAYSNEELQVVQLVADQVSIAIAQAELLEQAQQKAQQESLINQIAALLHSPVHPSSTLTTVLEQLTAGLHGIGARLQIFTSEGSTLHSHGLQPPTGYEDWLQEQLQKQTLLPAQQDQSGLAKVWMLSNLKPWLHFFEPIQQTPIRGLILLQLRWNDQQVGWLSVFRGAVYVETHWAGYRSTEGFAEGDPRQRLPQISFEAWRELKINESPLWSPADVELLSRVGVHLAMSIAQNQLYQQIQTLNIHLEKQVQERTAALRRSLEMEALIKRITDQVRDSLDEAKILRAVVQELALGLPIECCDICLYDPVAGEATVRYEYTATLPAAGGLTIPMAEHPALYQQLQSGQMSQFCDLPGQGLIPSRQKVAVLLCPLRDDQGVLGDLGLVKRSEHSFDELEMQLVQQVANHCAIAIRQARLYQTSLEQVEELERLNQLKDDFLSTVSHELRTPITNMKMAIHLLKSTKNPQKRSSYLTVLETECERETELVNDLLDLQRLELGSKVLTLEEIPLAGWLPSLLYPFLERAKSVQQDLQWQIDPNVGKVVTDQASLARVIQELVNNACKYTPPKHRIQVKAYRLPPGLVYIQVINEGIEIPPQEQERIFEKFYRIPNGDPWKRGGTGLGLALVKQLMERLKGSVAVESGYGKTCFTLVLPQGSLPTYVSPLIRGGSLPLRACP